MEKPPAASSTVNKAKKKFLSFLPKAAILRFEFDHQNITPFSPPGNHPAANNNNNNRGNYHHHHHHHHYNSGPITSVILEEARKSKSKNSRFDTKEPTSPKISCMGQIKIKKTKSKNKKDIANVKPSVIPLETRNNNKKKKKNKKSSPATSRKSDAQLYTDNSRAPSLSQMKRFASSRETLSNFDWTNPTNAQKVTPDPVKDRRRYYYYSDEDRNNYISSDDGEEEEEEEEDFKIPFSAPLTVGGGGAKREPIRVSLEPKKEINLWKRRAMAAQPKPLQLNTSVGMMAYW